MDSSRPTPLKSRPGASNASASNAASSPYFSASKKRSSSAAADLFASLSDDDDLVVPPRKLPNLGPPHAGSKSAQSPYRTPAKGGSMAGVGAQGKGDDPVRQVWMVQWRKPQNKKHKTWDGDGLLVVRGSRCTLQDTDGKHLASAALKTASFAEGDELFVGGKECEIDHAIPLKSYYDGTIFLSSSSSAVTSTSHLSSSTTVAASSFYKAATPKFRAPLIPKTSTSLAAPEKVKKNESPKPAHDPTREGALVMRRPQKEWEVKNNKKGAAIVDVVVDPLVGMKLRPHQREGVKFMYEAVMGMRGHGGTGCILADEMGLGKTLQTIALIWTLLKQNPVSAAGPVIGKAMIVCPVSLVNNWRKEFRKWIGESRIGLFIGDKDKREIKKFQQSRSHQVIIIGYEKLRTVVDELKYCNPPIGLIVCDEGHRLKSASNKTTKMFETLGTKRRIILSGTPIQNDLGEYYCMADFCNPGLLDTYSTFKRTFELPIIKSRTPQCTKTDLELGKARSEELNRQSRQFVLRRTADILQNYLPPKFEFVVFIAPTKLQLDVYKKIVRGPGIDKVLHGAAAQHLMLINILRKLCNSPGLILRTVEDNKSKKDESSSGIDLESTIPYFPPQVNPSDFELGGKLIALANLLRTIKKTTDEKVVLVSNFTQTLDILEDHCRRSKYKYTRLDGSTPQARRQELVDGFNKTTQQERFIFLLSSKSGGVGLNLIGASRLVLFESDWNPSNDLQAMARIHRDGQKRPVYIYRFLTTAMIDEKVYQRALTKMGLSESLMDNATNKKAQGDSFTLAELRDLFNLRTKTACLTHDQLECDCVTNPQKGGASEIGPDEEEEEEDDEEVGFVSATQHKKVETSKTAKDRKAKLAALNDWTHIDPLKRAGALSIRDPILRTMALEAIGADGSVDDEDADSEDGPRAAPSREGSPRKSVFEFLDEDMCPASDEDEFEEDGADDVLKPGGVDLDKLVEDGGQGRLTFLFEKMGGVVEKK